MDCVTSNEENSASSPGIEGPDEIATLPVSAAEDCPVSPGENVSDINENSEYVAVVKEAISTGENDGGGEPVVEEVARERPTSSSGSGHAEEYTTGEQTRIVTQLIKTIGRLRTENTLLEMQINDSDKHNKILQLQIDIMMKKMELLEGFLTQVRSMEDNNSEVNRELNKKSEQQQICRRCKKRLEAAASGQLADGNFSDAEEDVNVKDVLRSVGWADSDSEEDDNETARYSKNPLMIDIVVGNVMSFLPISTLLKCRLVNRLWSQEAAYALRQRQTLTISRDNIDKLPKLIELFSSKLSPSEATTFLFRKVKVEINFLVKTYREVLIQFFTEHGPAISHCTLHCDQENSPILYTEEVRNIFLPFISAVQQLELSFPTKITDRQTIYDDIRPKRLIYGALTSLKLRQMDVTLDIGGYSVAVVKELLKTAPNLKSLYLETHTKEVVSRVLAALNDKESKEIVNQLEELYLDAFLTDEHLTSLISLDFKLKALQLSYFTLNASSILLEAILVKHRTTLETLIVGDYQKRTTANSLPLIVRLPVLKSLKHLKFVDPLFPDHRQLLLNPLNFGEQLPTLEQITFDHEEGKPIGPHYFQDIFVSSPTACETLTEMKISQGLSEPQLVASAAKMFPKLKKLELDDAPNPVIQAVWREFTGLKTMRLGLRPTNFNIDSLMTGIPDQVCRRIQEKNLFSQVDLMNALDIIRTEPAICNLTELETLRVDGCTSSLITAVTGYLAICQMPNLSNIAIKSDIITLSRECRRVLGETLHLSLLEFF